MEKSDSELNRLGADRISSRQIDELVGLARGMCADGTINVDEAELLQSWLAANRSVVDQAIIRSLYLRVSEILSDGDFDAEEQRELFELLESLAGERSELGESLKATTLPVCDPPPDISFQGMRYCFTGTFAFGKRRACEGAVADRGGEAGSLTKKTNVLVIGQYATESWKHSSMGTKIVKAIDMRTAGLPITIVSEAHWKKFL